MSKDLYEEMTRRISEAQMELKIKLEQVSRLRVDCAKLQLELLRLYKPQCLEILETLEDVSEPMDLIDYNGDPVKSNNNNQLLCAIWKDAH